jgi:hypothetical protein
MSVTYPDLTRWLESRRLAFANVRLWHKADMLDALANVRFWGQSGHDADVTRCLLMTQSGH